MRTSVAILLMWWSALTAGAAAESWLFQPAADPFTDDALLDLRQLNEAVAGGSGFVTADDKGRFLRGDGEPIRFWSVVKGVSGKKKGWNQEQIDQHYRHLAKRGVNMTRLFTQICDNSEGAQLEAVEKGVIERIHRHVAAAKRNGIYVTISPYWSHSKAPASWGLAGLEQGGTAYGLLFTSERFRTAYRGWIRELMTRVDPESGRALRDEPAVALLQIHNEDSLFFHAARGMVDAQQAHLRRAFGGWAADRHGSIADALAAWDGAGHEDDRLDAGEFGLWFGWFIAQPETGGKAQRMADQIEFLAEHQRRVYSELTAFIRDELGCPHLINASNWKTADNRLLGDIELWTYAGAEVDARNHYMSTLHRGARKGYAVEYGDTFVNASALRETHRLPLGRRQVAGRPFIITELDWVFPNRYQAEGPFLCAVFASLSDIDGIYWQGIQSPTFLDPSTPWWEIDGHTSLRKWMVDTPQCMGLFPANALAYRRGDIASASRSAVHQRRSPEELWQRVPSLIPSASYYDPNVADSNESDGGRAAQGAVDHRSFMIGPVTVSFGEDGPEDSQVDLAAHIDGKMVHSLGGEIVSDTQVGVTTVDSPRYQGACGFLRDGGGRFDLSTVSIETEDPYAAVSVVSLDDAPLSESQRVLVQIGTVARPDGWSTEDVQLEVAKGERTVAGKKITATGTGPWRLLSSRTGISIDNPRLTRATRLDENGYAAGEVACERSPEGIRFQMPGNTLYVVLEP